MPGLAGRVVAVTGGARGIGLAIATALAEAGARVAIGDFDAELARQRVTAFAGVGLGLDVRDEHSYVDFLSQVDKRLGPVDVLVNNAGVAVPGTFLDTSAAEHGLEIEVNLRGVERGMRLALPGMIARGRGHVVNIASAAGLIPAPDAAVYTATKHAVVGLTHAVRSELRGSGVFLTVVLPTAVRTEMAAGLSLRGLPRVSAEVVARRVVRVLRQRRPPATVLVPRWLRPVAIIDAASPQWLRDLARRLATVRVDDDGSGRADYDARVARQLGEWEPEA